jgi:tight adherence protein B
MMTYILIGAIAIGIGGMIFAVSLIFQGGEREMVEDRLASLTQNGGRGVSKSAADAPSLLRSPLDDAPGQMEEYFKRFFNLKKFLEQSGKDVSTAKFMAMTFIFGGVAGVAAFIFSPWKSLAIPAVGLAAVMPYLYFWWVRKSRLAKFDEMLPQALDLMSQALRAGQSLPAGIQLVGTQMEDPLGPEFARAFEEQNLGIGLSETLDSMTKRVPNLDLRFFATAVVLQRQTGGDLAEILDKISQLTRERHQIKGQIQALTGEGRLSGIVLLGLPPVLFGVMLKLNYEYVMKLFTAPLGQKLLIFACVAQFIGAFVIKKIIDIKV